jgi:uncharacterized Zn-finger protein
MARIFWVVCPGCQRKFYAATADFRGKNRKLLCPYCRTKFTDEEAEEVLD